MTDGVIKGTGNSRYLKSVSNFKTLYPTYDDFAAALVAGTLPIDLKGINSSGWSTQGTPLTKANLLTDSTAALYGYGSTATVNQIFSAIKTLFNTFPSANTIAQVTSGSITGALRNGITIACNGTPIGGVLIAKDLAWGICIFAGTYNFMANVSTNGSVSSDRTSTTVITISGSSVNIKDPGMTSQNTEYGYLVFGRK